MKVLIVGATEVYSIENYFLKYFTKVGIESKVFVAQTIFYDYYYGSFLNKIRYKTGLSLINKKINRQFREFVDEFKPNIIWVFKGMEISPNSLQWAKKKGIFLVNYNPDNPFIFTGKGSGNKNVTNSIGLYDLHFTYNLEIQKDLQLNYQTKTEYLPFGYDIDLEIFEECKKENEIIKACFLGNPDKERASFILKLANLGLEIDVYGNKWGDFLEHKRIKCLPPIYGIELWKTLRKYRVQLNIMRIHNLDSHNMRTFEINGIGGIQVAPYTKEHNLFFKDGKEIFLFKDETDCFNKVNYLLNLSTQAANEIRNNARAASVSNKYSYKDRANFVLEIFNKYVQ